MGNLTHLGWLYLWMAVGCVIPHGEDQASRCNKSGRCGPGLICYQRLCVVDESSAKATADADESRPGPSSGAAQGADPSAVLPEAGTSGSVPSPANASGGLDAAVLEADAGASPPTRTTEDAGPSDAGSANTSPDAQSEEPPACPCCVEDEGKKACKKACGPSGTSEKCSSCDRSCMKGRCTPEKCGAP
jgi:hypothetical protein